MHTWHRSRPPFAQPGGPATDANATAADGGGGGGEDEDEPAGFDGMFDRTPLPRNDTAGHLRLLQEMDRECDAVQPIIDAMGHILAALPPREQLANVATSLAPAARARERDSISEMGEAGDQNKAGNGGSNDGAGDAG